MTGKGAARVGMIVPSSNTALEPALMGMHIPPDLVTFHLSRARVTSISLGPGSLAQFDVGSMCEAASLLADARPDVLVWAGAAGLWTGLDRDRALCHAITARTSVPAVTTALALVEACRSLGARRVGLVTPYIAGVVERIMATFADEGITVVAERHLGLSDNHSFALVNPDKVVAMALECAPSKVDAVVIACTNVSTAGTAAEIERRAQAPVLDSIAVTVWHALKVAGLADPGLPQRPGPAPWTSRPFQIGGK
jgi:maleate isomerase